MATRATSRLLVHLPSQPTPLIDRADELAFVRSLLAQDDMRLLTLIGPGGVGKTRLAIAAAEQVAENFPDGVWFVDLAPLADPALVMPTIARVVGVREQPAPRPLEALTTFLGERSVLLVVDNLEHLLAAAADFDALLRESPNLAILATSREPLHLRREHLFEVHALPVPGPQPASWTVANLTALPAVQLFMARAQAANASFELSPANAEAVAELSRRLEGLPLAVELAAARTRLFEPKALLAQMHQSLALLRWDAPDLPPRHRSLHATLEWSHALLTAHQQALFRRLAVFAGGFTLDGAEAVFTGNVPGADEGAGDGLFYQHPEPPPRPLVVLENLAALIDHSIVQLVDSAAEEPRYRMLETVREFGLERLVESGEEGEVRRGHLVYFVALAERLSERYRLPEAERVFARLDTEHDDVRAALRWAEASGEARLGLRLARAMATYWIGRGHLREGRGWLERVLEWGETPPSSGGGLEGVVPPFGRAPAEGVEGLRGKQAPAAERARALHWLAWLCRYQGDSERAKAVFGEALRTGAAAGARVTVANALSGLALVDLDGGRLTEAAARLDEALAELLDPETGPVGGQQYVSGIHAYRGRVAFAAGDLVGAAQNLEEAARRERELGFTWGLGRTVRWLGDLARARGDLDAALSRYRESLELAHESGYQFRAVEALDAMASAAVARGDAEWAARLCGATAALRERLEVALSPDERLARERDLATARAALPPAVFESAWAAGAALPLEAAIAEALADPSSALATRGSPPAYDPAAELGLTPREADVLRLLAHGHSNREIGEALFISPRTVNFHVTNLLAKLELDSRAGAAAFAVRHGLA